MEVGQRLPLIRFSDCLGGTPGYNGLWLGEISRVERARGPGSREQAVGVSLKSAFIRVHRRLMIDQSEISEAPVEIKSEARSTKSETNPNDAKSNVSKRRSERTCCEFLRLSVPARDDSSCDPSCSSSYYYLLESRLLAKILEAAHISHGGPRDYIARKDAKIAKVQTHFCLVFLAFFASWREMIFSHCYLSESCLPAQILAERWHKSGQPEGLYLTRRRRDAEFRMGFGPVLLYASASLRETLLVAAERSETALRGSRLSRSKGSWQFSVVG
jgi:hypothetical protein